MPFPGYAMCEHELIMLEHPELDGLNDTMSLHM